MRVVLDTNVWISSLLLPQSIPGQIISAWRKSLFDVVISQYILDEIKKVLNYPKIQKRLLLTQDEIDEYLTLIRFFTETVVLNSSHSIAIEKLRDKNDGPIWATFFISGADYLISSDEDLLVLKDQHPIISPSEFAIKVLGISE